MVRFPKAYTMVVDEQVQTMAVKDISACGADEFVAKACVRLDCSRIKNNMRLMQTISTPYRYEVTRTLIGIDYALQQGWIDENKKDEYVSKLLALHKRNLKYEETNPPIIYDKKKCVKKTTRTTRKKAKEGTLEGFEKPKKEKTQSAAQLNAQARAKLISKLKINI